MVAVSLQRTSPCPLHLLAAALAFILIASLPCHAAAEGELLMREGRYRDAAKVFSAKAAKNASDGASRLNLGICLLKLGDFTGADAALADAVAANPNFTESVSRAWKEEGAASIRQGKPDRALALYAKALLLTPSDAPELGKNLIAAADALEDETARARIVARASRWAGAEYAVESSATWFRKKLGLPRKAALDEEGWANIGAVRPGDAIYYLSNEPVRQRDAGSIRILPASIEAPLKLVVEVKDTLGAEKTEIWLGKHDKAAKVFYWLIPGGG